MALSDTQILELRASRAKKVKDANQLLSTAQAEKRDLSGEESETFDRLHAEAEKDLQTIEREERQAAANRTIETRSDADRGHNGANDNGSDVEARNAAIVSWCRRGVAELPADQREIMQRLLQVEETRALGTTVAAGGYTIAPDTSMYAAIVEGEKAYGFPEEICTVLETGTGGDLPLPTCDDTNQSGALVGENTDVGAAADPVFGQIVAKAYIFTSRELPVSLALLQDSQIDVDGWIGRKLGERLGRVAATYRTTGTGVSQPQGLVTASTLGTTATATAAITFNELVDLIHSVDPSHRKNGRFMFNDLTLKAVKKLTDSQNRPLWLPGTAIREPDTINNYPFTINQQMASLAAGAKTVLFGDFKKFLIRKVKAFAVQRLVERRAELGQVSFLGFERWDSKLLDAGTAPLKHLIQAAV